MRFIRLKEVLARTGLCRTTIYEMMGKKEFPSSVKVGARAIGFYEHEVDSWIAARRGVAK